MKLKTWTTTEREILKANYSDIPMKELLELLPGRTVDSIYKQVSYLRKRGWTFGKL